MRIKILKVSSKSSESLENEINENMDNNDIKASQVINIQYLNGRQVVIFYREI